MARDRIGKRGRARDVVGDATEVRPGAVVDGRGGMGRPVHGHRSDARGNGSAQRIGSARTRAAVARTSGRRAALVHSRTDAAENVLSCESHADWPFCS